MVNMFKMNNKIMMGGLFSFALLLHPLMVVSSSYAQTYNPEASPIEDVTVNIEQVPPQPTPATIPETPSVETFPLTPSAPKSMKMETNIVSPPPANILAEPKVSTTADGSVSVDMSVLEGQPQTERVPHSGAYYDSDDILPDSDLRSTIGPREVDPKYEPGSRFVVVKKGAGPDSIPAQIISAQRALSLGRYSSALEMYEQLYKRSPKNKQILMGMAVAQQKNGFNESAIATYEELLAMDPGNTDATVNMLGIIQTQYPSVAYRKLRELWEKNSQNPGLAAQLGLTSASIGNKQDAIRYLGIAATLEPNNPDHYYNMAIISDQAGADKDAVDYYQKALEVDVAYGKSSTIPREEVYDRLATLRRL